MSKDNKRTNEARGDYITQMLEQRSLNGDAYVMLEEAFAGCAPQEYSFQMFQDDLSEQVKLGVIHQEGRCLYLSRNWRNETMAAGYLADIIEDNTAKCPEFSEKFTSIDGISLSEEQCSAVTLALSHRLSVILGGAGTGKTTLIKKIVEERPYGKYILAAPTGKAAKNLIERTGMEAQTVHSILGISIDQDDFSPTVWEDVSLIVIDEASMMTHELLAGLLCKARRDCRIVLVGDPGQLLPVGSGNTLPDLLNLEIPFIQLKENHRQEDKRTALYHNVVSFPNLHSASEMQYDSSFEFVEMDEQSVEKALIDEAVKLYISGNSIQVLSPYNNRTNLSVQGLNQSLQARINPATPEKRELEHNGVVFRDGDRVIVTRNNYNLGCVNGDIGIFWVDNDNPQLPSYHIELSDGRCPKWIGWKGLEFISLAYAMTVHKSQGSQYDVVLMPMVDRFAGMLYRNLIYTAISRAKKQVILYGSKSALDNAVQTAAKLRRTNLVPKTQLTLFQRAA